MNEWAFMRKMSGDTSLEQMSQCASSFTEQDRPNKPWQLGTEECNTAVSWGTLDKLLIVSENINSIPTPFFHTEVLVFRQKLKSSEWTYITHFEWGSKTFIYLYVFVVESVHTINKGSFCTPKLVWLFTVTDISPLTKDTLLVCPYIKKWAPGGWLRGFKVKRKIRLQFNRSFK